MSSFSTPRSSTPTLSPAWPESSSLRNISTPVTTFFSVGLKPMISISSPTLTDAALDTAGDDGAAARDREHVFDRHQERLVDVALRQRDVGVERFHQLGDRLDAFGIAVERLERRHAHHRDVVAGEAVALEQLAHFQLDEVDQFRVVHRVDLVQGDDEVRHVDLAGEQHVLARLRHRAVDAADDQDRAVHLRRAGDHVLDVVGVARAVDVRVVPVGRAVFDVAASRSSGSWCRHGGPATRRPWRPGRRG